MIEKKYGDTKFDYYCRRFRLLKICLEYLKKESFFDVGFVRWGAADTLFMKVLKKMNSRCDKVLMDFHGYFPDYKPVGI